MSRLSNKSYADLWKSSGFPDAENPFPKGAKVDYRAHRQVSYIETGWWVEEGPNQAGFYTLKRAGATRHVHGNDIRCHLIPDPQDALQNRYEQERIAQWVYDPDKFSVYVAGLEALINNPPRPAK